MWIGNWVCACVIINMGIKTIVILFKTHRLNEITKEESISRKKNRSEYWALGILTLQGGDLRWNQQRKLERSIREDWRKTRGRKLLRSWVRKMYFRRMERSTVPSVTWGVQDDEDLEITIGCRGEETIGDLDKNSFGGGGLCVGERVGGAGCCEVLIRMTSTADVGEERSEMESINHYLEELCFVQKERNERKCSVLCVCVCACVRWEQVWRFPGFIPYREESWWFRREGRRMLG